MFLRGLYSYSRRKRALLRNFFSRSITSASRHFRDRFLRLFRHERSGGPVQGQCSKFKGEMKMVRLSYELSVLFDNPIIEIGHGFR
jgi:hypothetical protein